MARNSFLWDNIVEMDDQPSTSGTDLASSAMSGKDVSVSRTREAEKEKAPGKAEKAPEGTWVPMKSKKKKKRTDSQ